jgi:ArsR family transcriptional regulator
MAEGFARHKYAHLMEPQSAGTHPAPLVQPETIACRDEIGVHHDGHESKPGTSIDWHKVDLLINMSGMPVLGFLPPFKGGSLIWNVKDPIGKSPEIYREVREQIETLVDRLAVTLKKHNHPGRRKGDKAREG